MLTVYDSQGKAFVLTEQLGRGGEGTVFSCPDDAQLVAKIYHEPIAEEKARKLRLMAENKSERLLKIAAWITDTLHDAPGGRTIGFLMPSVRAKEIHELYSLKSRRVYFPEATWQFLVHAAANVARAFYNLHHHEHVMGDVNHGNCVVLADGTVKLIDCDSYSIKIGDFRYPCEVGVATHLAPELQGKNLRDAERLERHDNFGLAVIIFQLLFLGRHPFSGIYLGEEDKSIEDCIRELRFAYGKDALAREVKPPPGTLRLSHVSPRVAEMFERAFLTENRPSPQEWIEALEDLSAALRQCGFHPGHHYFGELKSCPWCEIEQQTGLMLFPFVTGKSAAGAEGFNIFTIENLLASLAAQPNLPAKPLKTPLLPAPSGDAQVVQKDIRSRLILVAIVQFLATAFFVAVFGGCAVFIPSLIILIICLTVFNNYENEQKIDLEIKLDTSRRRWEKLEAEWTKSLAPAEFEKDLAHVRKKIGDYQKLPKDSRQKLKLLQDATFGRELEKYLNSFRLSDTQIPGIGEKKLAVLRDFGVKTAADVETGRLRTIPGAGDATAHKLFEWRKNLERKFQYEPNLALTETEQKRIEADFAVKRRGIETEIERSLGALHSMSVELRRRQQQLSAKSGEIAAAFSQAESDLAAVAMKVPAMVTMISIALFMVVFGHAFHASSIRTTPNYDSVSISPTDYKSGSGSGYGSGSGSGYGSGSGIGSGSGRGTSIGGGTANAANASSDYVVADNLTDEEIEGMLDVERQMAADTLLKQANELLIGKSGAVVDRYSYVLAEQKLRLAIRLKKNDTQILNQLGYVLYEQEKYTESLKILNRSLVRDSENLGTKIYIGMNYLRMEKFRDARRIFTEATKSYPNSFESFFNLGLAYKGLKDHSSAINAFRTASEIAPSDADAHYEIGYTLYEMGDREGARREYEILLGMDTRTAENLKKIIGGK